MEARDADQLSGPARARAIEPASKPRRPADRHELEGLVGRRVPLQAKLEVGCSDDPLEHDADRVAERVLESAEGS